MYVSVRGIIHTTVVEYSIIQKIMSISTLTLSIVDSILFTMIYYILWLPPRV